MLRMLSLSEKPEVLQDFNVSPQKFLETRQKYLAVLNESDNARQSRKMGVDLPVSPSREGGDTHRKCFP